LPIIDSLTVIAPTGAYLVFKNFNIDDSEGNNDGVADYGETLAIHFDVKNVGNDAAINSKAIINTSSKWVKEPISNVELDLGNIQAGELKTSAAVLQVKIADKLPNQTLINFTGNLLFSSDKTTQFKFEIKVNTPSIEVSKCLVDKVGIGNHDSIIDSDESVSLQVSFTNYGSSQVTSTTLNFSSPDENLLTVLSDELVGGGFEVNQTKTFEVNVKARSNIFPGAQVDLKFNILATGEKLYSYAGTIPIILGVIPSYTMSTKIVEIITAYFYDSGGVQGKYSSNESSVITFIPHNLNQGLMIDFKEFNLESSITSCFDVLSIYDGVDTTASLLGEFCNYNFKDIIMSQNAAGALTFKFTSDKDIVNSGWKAYLSSANKYKVTFKVTDSVIGIDSAQVLFGNNTDTTSVDGNVVFENILAKRDKHYTIKKEGYIDLEGTVGEIISDTTIELFFKKLPDISFVVSDSIALLKGVEINFNGKSVYTDINGTAIFQNIPLGAQKFNLVFETYNDTSVIVMVDTVNASVPLKLSKQNISAIFKIREKAGYIEGAAVTLNGNLAYSNKNGEVVFSGLYKSVFDYTVSKQNYNTVTGSLNIVDLNPVVMVDMFKDPSSSLIESNLPYFKIHQNTLHNGKSFIIKSNSEVEVLKVFNSMGSLLVTKNNQPKEFELILNEINSGIYIFQAKIGNVWYAEKVFVK